MRQRSDSNKSAVASLHDAMADNLRMGTGEQRLVDLTRIELVTS
jgi:hypothetical protein